VALPSRRFTIARDAVELVALRISALPPSKEVDALRARAEDYQREVDGWRVAEPGTEGRNQTMNRILELYVEVAKWERRAPAK
jgi:hypothetical protein